MSIRIKSVLGVLLVTTIQVFAQQSSGDSPEEQAPSRIVIQKRDYNLTQAYADVFKILSDQNTCSRFYGGSRPATTVLNSFVRRVKPEALTPDVAFYMSGRPQVIHEAGASYRLFEQALVNTNGSFYHRREDSFRKFPSDVGSFAAGSRPARALILLHELGHLMQGEDGAWLLPDDGHDLAQSKANTLRVQHECGVQLKALK
jgi:hypothetical protein